MKPDDERSAPAHPENWIERIERAIAFVLQIAIAAVTIGALRREQWLVAFSGVAMLILTFAPAIIQQQLRVQLPVEFKLITCAFFMRVLHSVRPMISTIESGGET